LEAAFVLKIEDSNTSMSVRFGTLGLKNMVFSGMFADTEISVNIE
jgi:hypothetical protein